MNIRKDPSRPTILARLILSSFRCIPVRLRTQIFIRLFLAFYHAAPRRRLIAIYNLKRAFPEKSSAEIVLIAKGVYRNMAIIAAEFFEIPRLTRERIHEVVDVEGLEHCAEALKKNRGLLMIASHFGNWELQAIAFSLFFKPLVFLYRPLDNLFLDRLVTSVRSSTGNRPLGKTKAMRQMLLTIKAKGIVGLLVDLFAQPVP